MKRRISLLFLAIVGFATVASAKYDFSRYDVITSRKPFGEPPVEAVVAPAPVPPAATFIKDIRMYGITDHPEYGIRVGFTDIAAKKNYWMGVGDTEDGIQVVDADVEKEAALLQKGSDSFWVNMSGQVNPANSGPDMPTVPASGTASAPGGPVVAALPASPVAPDRMSYAERRRLQREAFEARQRQRAEAAAIAATNVAALQQKEIELRALQMDLIRAGGANGPALPMPLTREMDDQLVSEGVLPPQDGGAAGEAVPAPAEEVPAE